MSSRRVDMGLETATRNPRRDRLVYGTMAAVLLLVPVYSIVTQGEELVRFFLGIDYSLYMDATRRWLGGGPFYDPYQLAGPYEVYHGAILYPPNALPLFVTFSYLPAILWWIIPLGLTGHATWRLRPRPIVWPFLAFCLAWPVTLIRVATGNPVIWMVAALSLGTVYAWPSVLVILKPSLSPFALFGIRHRSWWVALAVLGAVSLLFAPLWIEWVTVIRNSSGGLAYSALEIPMMAFPVIVWVGRRRAAAPLDPSAGPTRATPRPQPTS